jgi:hypothetical protein
MVYRHVTACSLVNLFQRFGGTCGPLLHEVEGGGFLQDVDTSTKLHVVAPPNNNFISDMALNLYVGRIWLEFVCSCFMVLLSLLRFVVGQFLVTKHHNFRVSFQFCCVVCCLSRSFATRLQMFIVTRYTAISQGVHCLRNVMRIVVYCTLVCVNSLAPVRKVRSSLHRCLLNSEMVNSIMCRLLVPISIHTGK